MKNRFIAISLPIVMAFLAVGIGGLVAPSIVRVSAFEGTFAIIGGIWLELWATVKFAFTETLDESF